MLTLKININNIDRKLKQLDQQLQKLPDEAYQEFRNATPIRSGNARSKTRLRGDTIRADYPYAGVLNKGRHMTRRGMRGSDQAPEGMVKPTIRFIIKRVRQLVRGIRNGR